MIKGTYYCSHCFKDEVTTNKPMCDVFCPRCSTKMDFFPIGTPLPNDDDSKFGKSKSRGIYLA